MELKLESSGVVERGRAMRGAASRAGSVFFAEDERAEDDGPREGVPSSVSKRRAMNTVIIARTMDTMMISMLASSVGSSVGVTAMGRVLLSGL